MSLLLSDLRFAVRQLRRKPWFAATAIAVLGLGIGGTCLVFVIASAFLIRPLPFPEPDQLVRLSVRTSRGPGWPISYPNFCDWRREATTFEKMAAFRRLAIFVRGQEGTERTSGIQVSAGFFSLLGVPLLGRDLSPADDEPGAAPVAVISQGLARRRYADESWPYSSPLILNGAAYTVIGVLPEQFRLFGRADAYVSLGRLAYGEARDSAASIYAIGRLKPGMTIQQAQEQMDLISRRLAEEYPANRGRSVSVVSLKMSLTQGVDSAVLALQAAVVLVLLVACFNVSVLLLTRLADRRFEIAARLALGARPAYILRQFVAESLVLSALGTAVGMALVQMSLPFVIRAAQAEDLPLAGLAIDWRVLGFAIGIMVLTAGGIAIAPAFYASRADVHGVLRECAAGSPWSGRTGLHSVLAGVQIAVAVTLLCCSGVLARSLQRLFDVDPGVRIDDVLSFSVASLDAAERGVEAASCACWPNTDVQHELNLKLLTDISMIPGITAVASASPTPFSGNVSLQYFRPDAVSGAESSDLPHAWMHFVSPDYFRTIEMKLLSGRWLDEHDLQPGRFSAIINETMARWHWPDVNPVGRQFSLGKPGASELPSPAYTVVGVAANTKEYGLQRAPTAEIYLPSAQTDIIVRSTLPNAALMPSLRETVANWNKQATIHNVRTLRQLIDESLYQQKALTISVSLISVLGFMLAGVGIHGVVAYTVARRTREFGVRMAMGATPDRIAAMILRSTLVPVVLGTVGGGILSIPASRLLRLLPFQVGSAEISTTIAVAAVAILASVTACLGPIARGRSVHPQEALRQD